MRNRESSIESMLGSGFAVGQYSLDFKNTIMKKGLLAVAVAISIASCGDNNSSANGTSGDSLNGNMNTPGPAGDTTNQVINHGTTYPADTSNQNGNDSVKGTSRASRSTTPGNASGKAGRKE